jgi:hypothetical protein
LKVVKRVYNMNASTMGAPMLVIHTTAINAAR